MNAPVTHVWVCEVGSLHEGGSVAAIFAEESPAYDWLTARRRESLTNMREMRAYKRGLGEAPEDWKTSPIKSTGDAAEFTDALDYWSISRWNVQS